jgi:hypothetical protein
MTETLAVVAMFQAYFGPIGFNFNKNVWILNSFLFLAGFPPQRHGLDPRSKSYGICGGQSYTGVGFLRVLRFPCQFSFYLMLHNHCLSFRASGRRTKWTRSHLHPKQKKK